MRTEVAKDMATLFDPIVLNEIAEGASHCAVQLNKLALDTANQGQNDLAVDYMRDSDYYANLSMSLKLLAKGK
jgi:hypothetical protein